MSWSVHLNNKDGIPCKVENHTEGGQYPVGGTTEADLYVTYNYSFFFYQFLHKKLGLMWLNKKKAKDCIKGLEKAVKVLGDKQWEKDYWAPTPGNAGHALAVLLKWAKKHPNGIFEVNA